MNAYESEYEYGGNSGPLTDSVEYDVLSWKQSYSYSVSEGRYSKSGIILDHEKPGAVTLAMSSVSGQPQEGSEYEYEVREEPAGFDDYDNDHDNDNDPQGAARGRTRVRVRGQRGTNGL